MKLSVGIIVFPDFQILDASGPIAVFEVASYFASANPNKDQAAAMSRPPARDKGYDIRLLSVDGGLVKSSSGVALQTEAFSSVSGLGMSGLGMSALDTVMVVGGTGVHAPELDEKIIEFIAQFDQTTRRTTSVCSGAFILARTGLLRGRKATTHWRQGTRFAEKFPEVIAVLDKIFIKDDKYWSSAGVSAGIDLALALVEEDYGQTVAQRTAREMVIYYRRAGGQSQFSTLEEMSSSGHRFVELLAWVRSNIGQSLTVDDLAGRMNMSPRNFSRQFLKAVGRSPAKAIEQIRLEVAQHLVETTELAMLKIAQKVGYQDSERMRRSFLRSLGRSPRAVRTGMRSERTAVNA